MPLHLLGARRQADLIGIRPTVQRNYLGLALAAGDTFSRASASNNFDSTGTLVAASSDVAVWEYSPTTLFLRGLNIELARTNGLRNNSGAGLVAGTPGTRPNNWPALTLAGLTQQILGSGTESGIDYTDWKFSGTTNATSLILGMEATTQIAAVQGNSCTQQTFVKLIDTTNVANITGYQISAREINSGGAAVQTPITTIVPTTAALNTQLFTQSRTIAQATAAFVQPTFRMSWLSGVTVNVSVRIGKPQTVLESFPGSPITTSSGAVTRAADVLTIPAPNGNYLIEVVGGTIVTNGTRYRDYVTVTGSAWQFAWPAAALTAGERHLRTLKMWRLGA